MKLSEYIKLLQTAEEKHGDLEIVYSADDEGNRYQKFGGFTGAGMFFKEDWDFRPEEYFEDDEKVNAFCIN
jgi:hypothetical protein